MSLANFVRVHSNDEQSSGGYYKKLRSADLLIRTISSSSSCSTSDLSTSPVMTDRDISSASDNEGNSGTAAATTNSLSHLTIDVSNPFTIKITLALYAQSNYIAHRITLADRVSVIADIQNFAASHEPKERKYLSTAALASLATCYYDHSMIGLNEIEAKHPYRALFAHVDSRVDFAAACCFVAGKILSRMEFKRSTFYAKIIHAMSNLHHHQKRRTIAAISESIQQMEMVLVHLLRWELQFPSPFTHLVNLWKKYINSADGEAWDQSKKLLTIRHAHRLIKIFSFDFRSLNYNAESMALAAFHWTFSVNYETFADKSFKDKLDELQNEPKWRSAEVQSCIQEMSAYANIRVLGKYLNYHGGDCMEEHKEPDLLIEYQRVAALEILMLNSNNQRSPTWASNNTPCSPYAYHREVSPHRSSIPFQCTRTEKPEEQYSLKQLAYGSYAVILEVLGRFSRKWLYKKFIRSDEDGIGIRAETLRELSCQVCFGEHEKIVRFNSIRIDESTGDVWAGMDRYDVNVLDLIRGYKTTLTAYPPGESKDNQPEVKVECSTCPENIRNIIRDILLALQHLHKLNIAHRDLSPNNIVVNLSKAVYSASLIDLGLGRQIPNQGLMTPEVVTSRYRAPELLWFKQEDYNATALDIWSVGVIAAELMSRSILFPITEKQTDLDLVPLIEKLLGTPTDPIILKQLHFAGYMLLRKSSFKVRKDADIFALCQKDKLATEFVLRCLEYNPTKRITATEALAHPYLATTVNSHKRGSWHQRYTPQ